ncbi:cyclase family protein [Legionella sp.]|uniref:cyclase family protein n=1 Tax=Legionella sp. TaxID=459 RepID=UPI003C823588
MQEKKESRCYDLSTMISNDLVVFPGDPTYCTEVVSSLEKGDTFNLCHMHLGNHAGTHIDFPAHTIKNHKTSSDFPLEFLIGPGIIIQVPPTEKSVTKNFVARQSIMSSDIVFFKTANSQISKHAPFTEQYVYIEPDAAIELLQKGVKIVGIDYISVDAYDDANLTVHNTLLSKEVLIVEGLELRDIPEGRYEIYIMPLNIPNMDGLPARVLARS